MKLLVDIVRCFLAFGLTVSIVQGTSHMLPSLHEYKCPNAGVLAVDPSRGFTAAVHCVVPKICNEPTTCHSLESSSFKAGLFIQGVRFDGHRVNSSKCLLSHQEEYYIEECRTNTATLDEILNVPVHISKDAGGSVAIVDLPPGEGNLIPETRYITDVSGLDNDVYEITTCVYRCERRSTEKPTTQRLDQPTPTPQSDSPKPGIFGRSGGSGPHCFAAGTQVMTRQGPVPVEKLSVGTEVLCGGRGSAVSFHPVEWFYHKDGNQTATFLTLSTASGRKLSVSSDHLVPRVPCETGFGRRGAQYFVETGSVFAKRIQTGDCLIRVLPDGGLTADRVISVEHEQRTGIFSPITEQGTVVADDLLVSCYSSVENHVLQHTVHYYLLSLRRMTLSVWRWFSTDSSGFNVWPREEVDVPTTLRFLLKAAERFLPVGVYPGLFSYSV